MVAEGRAHRVRDVALLEGERGLLERSHQLPGAHEAEVASLHRARLVLRDLLRELAEVLPGPRALDHVLDLRLGRVLRVAASHRGHPHQHVSDPEALRLVELGPVLLVVGVDLRVRDRGGLRARSEQHVLEAPPLGLAELRLVGLHVRLEVGVRHLHRGHRGLDVGVGPRGPHLLVALAVGLPQLLVGDLHALLDQVLHLAPEELAPHLGLELAGIEPDLAQHLHVFVAGEPSVLLELADLLDGGPQLVVADAHALVGRPLDHDGLGHQIVDHLLGQAEPLGQLWGQLLPRHPRVGRHHVGLGALEALRRDLLAVDDRDRVALAAAEGAGPEIEEDARGEDEDHDDDQEHELQAPGVFAHHADHGGGLLAGTPGRHVRGLGNQGLSVPHEATGDRRPRRRAGAG